MQREYHQLIIEQPHDENPLYATKRSLEILRLGTISRGEEDGIIGLRGHHVELTM
jgi:hypothetical protein